jgi:hypothetical protein
MPRWLKLKAAAEYSSIGKHRLKDLAAKGVIRGYPDPDSARGDGDIVVGVEGHPNTSSAISLACALSA